jgi:5-methylcytosine-specific restriction endonuclease McrA
LKRWQSIIGLKFKGELIHKNPSDDELLIGFIELSRRSKAQALEKQPRKSKTSLRQRHIKARIRRELLKEHKVCSIPGCNSTFGLEVDHIKPIRHGGTGSKENLRVLCRNHNQKA